MFKQLFAVTNKVNKRHDEIVFLCLYIYQWPNFLASSGDRDTYNNIVK